MAPGRGANRGGMEKCVCAREECKDPKLPALAEFGSLARRMRAPESRLTRVGMSTKVLRLPCAR